MSIQETDKWMPVLKMSTATEEAIRTRENRQYKLKYKAELDETIRRVDKYQQNIYKAYAFLLENAAERCRTK